MSGMEDFFFLLLEGKGRREGKKERKESTKCERREGKNNMEIY